MSLVELVAANGPKTFFLTIGILFSNPFVPDWGLQFAAALAIGLALPEVVIKPLNDFVLSVPGVKKFESLLSKHERLKTIIPRILAGYVVTYIIGGTCLLIGYFIL